MVLAGDAWQTCAGDRRAKVLPKAIDQIICKEAADSLHTRTSHTGLTPAPLLAIIGTLAYMHDILKHLVKTIGSADWKNKKFIDSETKGEPKG